MKGQNWWIITLSGVLLVLATIVRSDDPTELSLNQRFPDKDETEVCGNIRDVIKRDSGRFRRILVRNTNDQVEYVNDDARRMTSRTKSKLDVLASLVISEWPRNKVRVIGAWTDQVVTSDPASLHYEGMLSRYIKYFLGVQLYVCSITVEKLVPRTIYMKHRSAALGLELYRKYFRDVFHRIHGRKVYQGLYRIMLCMITQSHLLILYFFN